MRQRVLASDDRRSGISRHRPRGLKFRELLHVIVVRKHNASHECGLSALIPTHRTIQCILEYYCIIQKCIQRTGESRDEEE